MCGGLAVISDVPKTLVYRLADFVNSRSPVIPRSTIEKPPSAELRPDQKDSDSLPPYEMLDTILEEYVEDNQASRSHCRERTTMIYRVGAQSSLHGGQERIQTPAGSAGIENIGKSVWVWTAISDSCKVKWKTACGK